MRKKVDIWFHSGATSDIKEFSIRKTTLGFILLAVITAIGGASFIGYDYFRLKKTSLNNTVLNQTIIKQNDEIKNQRSQVQNFAGEIEILKQQVDNLSKFEDKVRLVADIKQTSDSSGLIGIGGIPRDELDPDIPLEQKHNSLMREMHQQVDQTNLAAQKQTLDFEHLIKMLEQKRNLLASTPSIRPVDGWISSRFGYRKSPFTGKKEFHSGLDISNKSGKKILATADGRISYAARKMYFGNLVMIDHGHGRVTKYGHLKKLLVKRGQQVKRGDVIGLLGNTGKSTGPHVHYEVRINGTPVNPLKYILN
ncbi:MAG: peptidoglycan DD-metalloendopeptidase family protein [Desulfobacterales bacterium]|nr:peptidoglycan DD-metalloendopeptidase family protein [Desulfobacterales bacterium]MBU8911149.1 peptidoglycan DD-metalloendopeptidase family protein [Desulfobacterales bacterium]